MFLMNKIHADMLIAFSLLGLLLHPVTVSAVTGVNPSGVNVKHNGVSTVFLTFQNLGANERAVESFWCGDVTTTAASAFNPCVPGTLFGKLPSRHNLSQISGGAAQRNLTDIMTIPASVARRAFLDARRGANSDFFYVRRFTDGSSDTYVTVTCRLAGGGARSPLALTNVQMYFKTGEGARPVFYLSKEEDLVEFGAYIRFTGTGRLKGRWEVALPGDPAPTDNDLLTEATLPVEQRAFQRRYTLIDRFDLFLPPSGSIYLPGPAPELLPKNSLGAHKILLRIEASADREGNSNTLNGVAVSGGVAGFPMPMLRYFVGSESDQSSVQAKNPANRITLLSPVNKALLDVGQPFVFSWIDMPGVTMYQLEIERDNEAGKPKQVLSAMIKPGESQYVAPPWLADHSNQQLRWRVRALANNGSDLYATPWRLFNIDKLIQIPDVQSEVRFQ